MNNHSCGFFWGLLCFIVFFFLTNVFFEELANVLCEGKAFGTIDVSFIPENGLISPIFLVFISSIAWAIIIYKSGVKFADMYSAKSGRDGVSWEPSFALDGSYNNTHNNDTAYVELSGGFHERNHQLNTL